MKLFHSARWFLLALVLSLVPASSYAGVFISVGFAPPPLPVYVQPPCPQPGLMWTPGYWAYGPDGYYWVPGAWVPAPYSGALWTPGYWGYSGSLYMWHPGYWGPHVGYYGGVNYGFGYMGVGFVGGMWRGHDFVYNTAVMHVNTTVIHNTYIDRTIVERNTIVNDRRVAYNGGPGGIRHEPMQQERIAEHDTHMQHTSYQAAHANAAMNDHNAYFRSNNGHPPNAVYDRPQAHPEPPVQSHFNQPANQYHPQPQQYRPQENHQQPVNQYHPQQQPQQRENHQQPQQFEPRGNPQGNQGAGHSSAPRPSAPQQRPEGQPHPQAQQPHGDSHEHGKGR